MKIFENLFFFKNILSLYYFLRYRSNKSKVNFNNSVVFFNTFDQGGGAAKVCFQLFSYFSGSYLFVREKKTSHTNVFEFDPDLWNYAGRLARKIESDIHLIDFGKLGVLKLLKNKNFIESPIVHIHNSHGYYLSFLGIQLAFKGKKIIWTLHDDYLLTGHCSFSMNCEKWMKRCELCPSLDVYPALKVDTTTLNQLEKKDLLMKLQPCLVAPSNWLAERVKLKYPFIKNVKVIHNGVDTNVFNPIKNNNALRIKYNIPTDKKVILFIAELSLKNPFKGGDIILEIVDVFKENEEYVFLTVGGEVYSHNNLISLPYIKDDHVLSDVYNLADIMLYPTRADNLPLVVLESMSCGVPVLSNNIAGIPEIIEDGFDGFLVTNHIVQSYVTKLNCYFSLSVDDRNIFKENSRRKVAEKFDIKKMLTNYELLYNSLSQDNI
jgi:glycosyltransferase involved in cell wall biosynthesis